MSFRVLKFLIKHLIKTRSVIIKFDGNDHLIDNGTDPLILQINNKKFLNKIFYAPSLVLTEGYMDNCLLYTSQSPRDVSRSGMPSSS